MLISVNSKTARLHRRQAANRRKYARLRKAGRVPQHTQAERRHAAAERERQREADQRHVVWLRRGALPVATAVTAAAASVVFSTADSVRGAGHVHYPFSAASQPYPYVPFAPEDPDLPHVPEPAGTFYTAYNGSGTATTATRFGPAARAAFQQAYGIIHID
jgi:hypothetical protein